MRQQQEYLGLKKKILRGMLKYLQETASCSQCRQFQLASFAFQGTSTVLDSTGYLCQ